MTTLAALDAAYTSWLSDRANDRPLFDAMTAMATQIVARRVWGHDLHVDRENVTADAVFAAWRKLEMVPVGKRFSWWFVSVVKTYCRAAVRVRYERKEDSLCADVYGIEQPTQALRIVEAADENRPLIETLRCDYNITDAATAHGLTAGAVNQRLQRIKTRVQRDA